MDVAASYNNLGVVYGSASTNEATVARPPFLAKF